MANGKGGPATPTYVANPATGHWEQEPAEATPTPAQSVVAAEPIDTEKPRMSPGVAEFKALIRISVLEDALRPICALRDEAVFELQKGIIECRVVDAAHVALADVILTPAAFEKFKDAKDGTFELAVDELWDALRHANKIPDQFAWLEVTPDKVRLSYGRQVYQADLPEIADANVYWPNIPTLGNLPATLSVGREDYLRTLGEIADITDHVRESATAEDGFKVWGEDADGHSWTAVWPEKEAIVKLDGPAKSIYPLDYLSNIVRSIPRSCTHVTLKLGTDYPTILEWPILKAMKPVGNVLCMLAPRIESE